VPTRTELDGLRLLRAVEERVGGKRGAEFFHALVEALARALAARCCFVSEFDLDRYEASAIAFWNSGRLAEPFRYGLTGSPCERVLTGEISAFPADIRALFPAEREAFEAIDAESYLAIPLVDARGKVLGHLAVIDSRPRDWSAADFRILRLFSSRSAMELERRRFERELANANAELEARVATRTAELTHALAELGKLQARLQHENRYLQQEIAEQTDGGIIGSSPALRAAQRKVELVAATDTTVLIHGETGTGKELFARQVHERSRRRDRPLVKLNCSALSAGLVESELFGHVKGAFTGATERRVGRFELADGGTLFLDEVSELSGDTQAKLLRVLQEREFEPVGSSKTLSVNVRIIAASNRDLARDAASGRFRRDLYYRLNVFPIDLPALRDRRDDIPELAAHFMHRMARKLGRPIQCIEPSSLARLVAHDWPGNIRDLQNTIERAAVLAAGPELVVDWLPAGALAEGGLSTLESVERQHFLSALRRAAGRVEGPSGAARILGLKPSTTRFRMRKLGIRRSDYETH
jgi:transcriptional regulator with GAF, ATPase, and Fis domain